MAVNENKWGLLYCPRGGWRSAKRWEKIEKVLRQQGVDYDFVQSENQKSVERLVKMFVNNGYKTIVIVGGDSALNDAVNCLMQMDASERNEVALGVIPNGLMNDFARFWGFDDSNVEQTVAWLKKRRVRKIDLGMYPIHQQERGEVLALLPQLCEHRTYCCDYESASPDPSCLRFQNAVVHLLVYSDDLPASRLQDAYQDQL